MVLTMSISSQPGEIRDVSPVTITGFTSKQACEAAATQVSERLIHQVGRARESQGIQSNLRISIPKIWNECIQIKKWIGQANIGLTIPSRGTAQSCALGSFRLRLRLPLMSNVRLFYGFSNIDYFRNLLNSCFGNHHRFCYHRILRTQEHKDYRRYVKDERRNGVSEKRTDCRLSAN